MVIYKTINKLNGHWYIGKDAGNRDYYLGSGKILKLAIAKYGPENFEKVILEECYSLAELNAREKYWIEHSNATMDKNSYNLATGGEGGNLSKFIDYDKRGNKSDNFAGARKWFNNLCQTEKDKIHLAQGQKRTKGWFVSTIDDPTEIFVQNIAKWCEENGIDKAMPSSMNNPRSPLYLKQTKGYRIRRADMPMLPPYENKRHIPTNNGCKGKTWTIIDGKRIWVAK